MIYWIKEQSLTRLLCVLITVALLLLNSIWLPQTALVFDVMSALPGVTVAFFLAIYAIFYSVVRPSERISSMAGDASILIVFSHVGSVYGYLIATSPYPLYDELLTSLDRMIGFNWLAYNEIVFSSMALRVLSLVAYYMTLPLVVATMIWLSLKGRTQESREFVLSIILGAIVCITISWFIPAAGAVGYYSPDDSLYNGMIRIVDLEYKQDYFKLRAGETVAFSMEEPKGLVAFPSYHVCMAILTTLALRHYRLIFWSVFGISFATFMSTPVDGGHHLVDGLAGALVGIMCFYSARHITTIETKRSGARP